jgi:hypothetical protein
MFLVWMNKIWILRGSLIKLDGLLKLEFQSFFLLDFLMIQKPDPSEAKLQKLLSGQKLQAFAASPVTSLLGYQGFFPLVTFRVSVHIVGFQLYATLNSWSLRKMKESTTKIWCWNPCFIPGCCRVRVTGLQAAAVHIWGSHRQRGRTSFAKPG